MSDPAIQHWIPTRLNAAALGISDLLILGGVILPSLLGLLFKLHFLPALVADGPLPTSLAYLFCTLAIVPVLAAMYFLTMKNEPGLATIFIVLSAAVVLRVLYVLLIDNVPTSDYKTMWDYALSVANGKTIIRADSIQELRSLPYFLPIATLGGGSRMALELANVITTVGSGLLIYWMTTKIGGRKAGVAALVLVLFAPEPFFACEIPTHDIPGNLFMLASIAFFVIGMKIWPAGQRSFLTLVLYIMLGGIFVGLAEIQRSTGRFIYAALLTVVVIKLFCLVAEKRFSSYDIMAAALFIVTPVIFMALFKSAVVTCCSDETEMARAARVSTWGWIASYAGPDSHGEYAEYRDLQPIFNALPESELPSYAIGKVAGEYARNPAGFLSHYKHKAERLYNLGRQGREYYGDSSLRQAFDAYTGLYAILLLLMSPIAFIVNLSMRPGRPETFLPILTLAWLATALIAFGEIQSRYVSVAWYVLPAFIATTFSRFDSNPPALAILKQRIIWISLASVIVIPLTIIVLALALHIIL